MSNIEIDALRLLENPHEAEGLPRKSSRNTLLRLWRYPAIEPYSSWTIFTEDRQATLRRVVWDKPKDYRPAVLEPSIYCADALFDGDLLKDMERSLSSLVFPPFMKDKVLGLDGVIWGLEYGDRARLTKIQWWGCPPAMWSELQTWVDSTIDKFESVLPACTAELI